MGLAHSPRIVTDGLVLALDAGNTKSYPGSGTTWTDFGPTYSSDNGGYFSFDGSNDYVSLSRIIQDDFTISCWFKTTQSYQTSTQVQWYRGAGLVDAEVSGITNDFGMSLQAGKVDFGVGNPDTTIQSTLTYNDDIWHCAVGTRNKTNGSINLYVDGSFITSGTGNTNSLTGATTIRIGSIQTNIQFFNGNIAQVSMYNRALTASEIQQNFNALRGRFGI
jgi:hypothetical protein